MHWPSVSTIPAEATAAAAGAAWLIVVESVGLVGLTVTGAATAALAAAAMRRMVGVCIFVVVVGGWVWVVTLSWFGVRQVACSIFDLRVWGEGEMEEGNGK